MRVISIYLISLKIIFSTQLITFASHIKLIQTIALRKFKSAKLSIQTLENLEYGISITFSTHCLVKFEDENNCPKIKEFHGRSWSFKKLVLPGSANRLQVFVNNYRQLKGETLILSKKIGDTITEKIIQIDSGKLYEGWFELE